MAILGLSNTWNKLLDRWRKIREKIRMPKRLLKDKKIKVKRNKRYRKVLGTDYRINVLILFI